MNNSNKSELQIGSQVRVVKCLGRLLAHEGKFGPLVEMDQKTRHECSRVQIGEESCYASQVELVDGERT